MTNAQAQHFRYSITSESATVSVPLTSQPNINGSPLVAGDEIGAFSPAGLCVGAVVWDSANKSIAVWGDDGLTDTIDGMKSGEQIFYRVWRQSTDTEYSSVTVTYTFGTGIYSNGSLHALSSLTATAPPESPVLTSPSDGASGISTSPSFSWVGASFATSYGIQIAAEQSFASPVIDQAGITTTTYGASGLANSTTYYWRVNSSNSGGTSDWSTARSFTTVVAAPAEPTLASPLNGAVNQPTSLTLSWNASTGASSYQVQLSTDSAFGSTIIDQSNLTGLTFDASGLSNGITYYWRVNATNAGGTSGWSTVWNFATVPSIPSAPTLTAPADGATGVSTSPNLTWNVSSGADSYQLHVSADSTFATTSVNESGLTNTSFNAVSLTNATKYYWRVSATNAGGTSNWSAVWSFTTVPSIPAAPVLASPADGSTGVSTAPTLSWNASGGADSYQLQVSADSTFATTTIDQSNLTSLSFSATGLSNGTKYFWRVNAKNAGGTSDWSSMWSFTTLPVPPAVPILASPADASTGISTSPTLSWNASSGAGSYQLQVSTSSTFATTVVDQSALSATSFPVGGLSNSTLYYWRVNASNAGGTSDWSNIWSFTTVPTAPAVPTLSSPANGAVDVSTSPNLVWNSSGGTDTYRLQVSADSNFATTNIDQTGLTGLSFTASGLGNGLKYYWRVSATNAGGTSDWSIAWSFTTIPLPPPAPTLLSPANGATGQSIPVIFSWNPSSGATFYHLQVATTSSFSSTVFNDTAIVQTSQEVQSLLDNTTYYWRVRARNSGGSSAFSTTRSFTTRALNAPTVTTSLATEITATSAVLNGIVNPNGFSTRVKFNWGTTPSVPNAVNAEQGAQGEIGSGTEPVAVTSHQNGILPNTKYYFTVTGFSDAGTTVGSLLTFVTQFGTIVPQLASPSNNSTNQPISPTLVWNALPNAISYRLQVSNESGFGSLVFEDTSIADTSKQISSLQNESVYYWRVSARNPSSTSGWSAVWNFTTLPAVPSAPTLSSPADGAVDIATDPTLSWNSATDASTYRIQVSADSLFTTTTFDQSGIAGTAFNATGLLRSTIYFWRTNATNAGGTGDWSAVWRFRTIPPPPDTPTLSLPSNGAVDRPTTITLRWNAASGASGYRLQVATVSNFSTTIVDQNALQSTSFEVSGLANNTTHYWRVNASNAGGTSDWSSVWGFTTGEPAPLPPTLVSPSNGATDQPTTLTLTWSSSATSGTYRLQVSTSSTFSTLFTDDSTLTTTSREISGLSRSTSHNWRVRVTTSGGTSNWSSVRNFITVPPPPEIPALLSPASGSTNISTTPTLAWNAVTGASSYHLQLSQDSTFATVIVDQAGVASTNYAPAALSNSTTYYWRVRSANAGGSSDWSTAWNFTTVPSSPAPPTLSLPADNATGQPTTLRFEWNPSTGADSYNLQVSTSDTFATTIINQTNLPSTFHDVAGLSNGTTYFWRVSASNAGGNGGWSSVRRFTTIVSPPGIPALASPADNSTDVSLNPILAWTDGGGADSYQLQVATSSDFSILFLDESSLVTNSRQLQGLALSTKYFWRVRATNVGGTSNWSSSWSFTTIPAAPAQVVLASPADGSTNQLTSLLLSWNAAERATSYRLQLSTSNAFSSLIVDDSALTSTSQQVQSLAPNTSYYWRVRASNAGGVSAWSTVWSFATVPEPPAAPTLLSPANAAQNVSTSPTLSWNASTGAQTYQVQVSTSSAFTTILMDQSDLSATSFPASGLANGTVHYWRVRATNTGGTSNWSAVWSFTTLPTAPAAPTPTSPPTGAIDQPTTLTLSWSSVTGTSSYRVQVANDSNFTSVLVDDSVSQTSRDVGPLSYSTRYYWRVRAANAGGISPWSQISNFTTQSPQTPPGPVLASPPSGSLNQPTTPTLSWNAVVGTVNYHLQVSSDPSFGTFTVNDSSITSTSQQVGPLTNATTYYWRVRSKQIAVTSNWSSVWNFTTVPAVPPTPTLVSPLDNATNVSTSPTFSWNVSTGAIFYRLQVSANSAFSSTVIDQSGITSTSFPANGFARNATYYWRVNATNAGGTSDWSSVWSFTTLPNPPATPVLASPLDGSNDISISPILMWNASSGATSYRLQASTNESFSSVLVDRIDLSAISDTLSNLAFSTRYYWRVNAKNGGGTSAWSTVWDFRTVPAPPATPSLASPANGSLNQPTTILLSWNSAARASTYRLRVSADSTFVTTHTDEANLSALSKTISSLLTSSTYYWRVQALNSGGASPWSTTWNFITVPSAPAAPVLATPANGTTGVTTSPTLSWNSVVGAASYQLQVALDSVFTNFVLNASDILSTSYPLNNLNNSTMYFWRTRAFNAGGAGAWSSVWSFTTVPPSPGVPTLLNPFNGAKSQPVVLALSWESMEGVSSYQLHVSPVSNFSFLKVDSSGIQNTALTVSNLEKGTLYHWRVRASNAGGQSDWSAVWNFETVSDSPPAPALSSPSDGSTNQPVTVTLSWNASTNATSYRLQLSRNTNFATSDVDDSSITTTSRQVGPLNEGTTYYWHVNARNSGGPSPWSPTWNFSTQNNNPQAGPTLVSPPNGATNQPTTLTFSWNSDPLAVEYHLQVSTNSAFSSTVFSDSAISGTSRTVSSLNNNTAYYWRVRSRYAVLWSDWSNVWSFITIPLPPPVPTLTSPANGSTNVTTTPTLSWDAPLSSSCQLQVSTNIAFTTFAVDDSTLTQPSKNIGPLATSTIHYWRVRAKNDGGWSGFSATYNFTTASGGSPIAVTNPPTAVTPTSATLNATINPYGYSTVVKFDYGTSTAYGKSVDATPPNVSGTASVDVSTTLNDLSPNTTYHYRVMATNSGGTTYGDNKTFTTPIPPYPQTYTVETRVSFPSMSRPGEYKTTDYRLVGLPGESDSRVESMIQGVPEKDWMMYWDNGAPTDNLIPYNSSNDIFRFTVGRAFWLINKGPLDMSGNIQTAQLNSSDEVEIPLHSGWNLISNPFDRPVLWSKLQNLNGTSEQIWSFSGSYDSSATLAPYVGYYFFNKESLPFLRIPYSAQFPNDTVSSSSPEPLWKIQIAASSGEIVDKSSWIGTSPGASVDRDDLDYHKPRGFGGTPAVYFDRPEWDEHYTSFGADFRPPVQRIERWSFNVESAKGARVDLTFKGISTLPAHLHTYLLDEKRARAVNLRSDSVYSYTSVSEVSQFVVSVGTQDAVDELLQSFNVPRRFVLGNNFPNPFNPSTLISFDIPTGSEIDLKIFNMIGQEVRTLYAGTAEPGRHWVLWDGKDNLGMQVPSGVYLYRLATNVGFSETRKMILLK